MTDEQQIAIFEEKLARLSPEQQKAMNAEMLARLSPEQLRKVQRAIMKLMNKSPKVVRLQKLYESGHLSANDFLDIAGA